MKKTGSKALAVLLVLAFVLAVSVAVFMQMKESVRSGGIAVVRITGVIYDSRPVVELLRRYGENPAVRAVVVRIDSPGGGVAASQEIYEEVYRIRVKGEKPVVASLGGVAASGGYYIACAAEKIIANPGTVTGSVGAIISVVNMEELFSKIGLEHRVIKSGGYKDAGSPLRSLTPEEETLLQGLVDDIHRQFIGVVRERRGLDEALAQTISDGRVLTGEQAMELGLLDGTGTFYDAVDAAAELAGLEKWDIIEERRRRTLRDFLLGSLPFAAEGVFVPMYLMHRGQ